MVVDERQTPGLAGREPKITPQQCFSGFSHFCCWKGGARGTEATALGKQWRRWKDEGPGLLVAWPSPVTTGLPKPFSKTCYLRKTHTGKWKDRKGDWRWRWTELSPRHVGGGLHVLGLCTRGALSRWLFLVCVCVFFLILFSKNLFYWSIADLQCCVNFCGTAKWFNYIHFVHILFHYGSWQDTG